MESNWLRRTLSLIVALLIAAPAVAGAQSGGDRDRSDLTAEKKERLNKLIESARKDYQNEQYRKSVKKLKEAYELYPNPAFFYRIALAYQNAGEPEQAIEYFERYLEQKPDSSKREEIEGRIADLEEQLEEAEESAPSAEAQGQPEDSSSEQSGSASSGSGKTDVSDASESGSGLGTGPLVAGGIGGLGAISGITFGILSLNAKQRKDQVTANNELTREEARQQGLINRPRRFGTVALISGGVAIVGLGTAAILMATGDRSGEKNRALSPALGDSQVGVSPTREGEGVLLRFESNF